MSSNIAITSIRTGRGDHGDTVLGGKIYRKSHPLVKFCGALDLAQAHSVALPVSWDMFEPREILQELLFRLGAVAGSRNPREQELAIQEIGVLMESQIEFISSSVEPLDSFLRVTLITTGVHKLRTAVRAAEVSAIEARDRFEVESKDLSENLIYMLDCSIKVLNIASDWVFAFIWALCVQEDGTLIKGTSWKPWTEEKVRSLNLL